jgi:citrate/tricarballylate utilization protein
MHATEALVEADRLMTLCNSCRYCEGLCAVFPAMEMRRSFNDSDLSYLANLCHSCSACYIDCQFSPPHEFDINVPKTLARVRGESYAGYAWPGALSGLFARNGLFLSITLALSVASFIYSFSTDLAFLQPQTGAGAFYQIMPHTVMALLFGIAFLYAVLALIMSVRNFWRGIDGKLAPATTASVWQAIRDAASLRYLDGGGAGCLNAEDAPKDMRKHYHHATFYGFLLCFAATCIGTAYHYLLGREAPYPWYDLPVLLGTIGGIGLVVGPIGLLVAKARRAKDLLEVRQLGMDAGFTVMLLLTAVTGLLLLMLRQTAAMNPLLALHLGVVFALFVTLPYGKFVHGIYRFAALIRYAQEQHAGGAPGLGLE